VDYRARAVVELPVDYARLRDDAPLPIGFVYDGSDPATATTLQAALPAFFRLHFTGRNRIEATELVTAGTRYLYNPQQESALFFVPGLMATILAMIGTLLTSVTVTREKELGTMTNLRLSSLTASEVIVGKLAPYFAIASCVGVFILLIGRLAFGVVAQGSYGLLAWTTGLYLLVSLGIGLFISTVV
jgi:ABC-2 type transport system permease protein